MAALVGDWVCDVDLAAFEFYCEACGDYRRASDILAAEGNTVEGSRGQTRHRRTPSGTS